MATMSRGSWETDPERRKKVGHYVLGPSLGEGSFSKMRIGTHVISREKVAVKIVPKRVIIRREWARRNFRREALLLQHVSHPHVVRLYEAMETPNSYYLVLELADRGTLLAYITHRKCLEEAETRHFMRQITSAVDHLHRSAIVHRDLRLENLLLDTNHDIKITDFGASALCQRENGLLTQCGSPAYAAPEIFGNRRYGAAVDLWSMGVCLYAMVVGRLPFLPDPPTNLPQLHALILKGAVIPAFLSQGLQHLLGGLLEIQESRRLTVCDVMHHPWMTQQGNSPLLRHAPVSQLPPPAIDTGLVRYMAEAFGFNQSDVIHSVTERKLNASSSTYHLLQHHLSRTRRKSDGVGERSEVSGETSEAEAGEGGRLGLGGDEDIESSVEDTPPNCRTPRSYSLSHSSSGLQSREKTDRSGGDSGSVGQSAAERQNRVSLDYKQCILYLKEARAGFAHSSRAVPGSQTEQPPSNDASVSNANVHSRSTSDTGTSGPRYTATRKLPLLNVHRHFKLALCHPPPPPPPPLPSSHGGSGGNGGGVHLPGAQVGSEGTRHFLHPLPASDLHLNVLGRPAPQGRGERERREAGDAADFAATTTTTTTTSTTNSSHNSIPAITGISAMKTANRLGVASHVSARGGTEVVSTLAAKPPPPPPPPNTAHGPRTVHVPQPTWAKDDATAVNNNGHRPDSSESSASQPSLRDPFGRDTWRAAFRHDLRLALDADADTPLHPNPRPVSFVAPLSSPKALTSRQEARGTGGRGHNYVLVRKLAAELHRKRGSPANKKSHLVHRPLPPRRPRDDGSSDEDNDGHDDDGMSRPSTGNDAFAAESLDKGFLTPVIRVTITSTAKH